LAAIKYDNQSVLEYWDRLYDIINFRLSGQIAYDWNPIIRKSIQLNNEEKLISLLLTRFKYGEANRYKWIISDLNNLLEQEEVREKFTKPFILFLDEKEQYTDYSLIMLLLLIKKFIIYEESERLGIVDSIESIYPTQNPIINYIIRTLLHKGKNRLYLNYKHKYNFSDERTNYLIDRIKRIDTRVLRLNRNGVDIGHIIYNYTNKTFSEDFTTKFRDILYNRQYSVLVPNVYFYDQLTESMGNEVDEYLNSHVGNPHYQDIEEKIFNIVLDNIPLIIAQNNSIIPRPKDLMLPEFIKDCVSDVKKSDWIRIAYHEKWFYNREENKSNFNASSETISIVSGIGFKGKELLIPFLRLDDEYNLFDENYYGNIVLGSLSKLDFFITSNVTLFEDPFLTYKINQYLGIRSDVLHYLGIKIIENGSGIVGITEEGEEVLRYSRWDANYSSLDSNSDRIPYLLGSQLLMKETKFNELCHLVNKKPYLYTNKIYQS